MKILVSAITFLLIFGCAATCSKSFREDKASAFAAVAGQATMMLGGCERPMRMGHDNCLIERGRALPKLSLAFANEAEYFVSDCEGGIFKQGSVPSAQLVEMDISPLKSQIDEHGLCLLEVHAKEYYADPGDSSQKRMIPLIGGFFVRSVQPGYFPIPNPNLAQFCIRVDMTSKGRRTVKRVTCD